jgi:hypothetical protein
VCSCSRYEDLEFLREAIAKRIRESGPLKKVLVLVADHPTKEHKLYRCSSCGQLWQGSRAWNWGNDEYLFKVPPIEPDAWNSEVFVRPDELLIFTAIVGDFLNQNTFAEKEAPCSVSGCERRAVSGSVNCLRHHLESLQRARTMPAYPTGRWFKPYVRENVIPAL